MEHADSRLLPLKLVDGADLRAFRQKLLEKIYLQVIRRNNQNILQRYWHLFAIANHALSTGVRDEFHDGFCLGTARLRAAIVRDRNEGQPRRPERGMRILLEYEITFCR